MNYNKILGYGGGILIFLVAIISLSSPINASQQSLGTFPKNSCIQLLQLCGDCSYNNITSIVYPNSSRIILDAQMTKRGAEFNYTFCDTEQIGTYYVNGIGDLNGEDTAWAYEFEITLTGNDKPDGILVVLFTILFLIILCGMVWLLLYTIFHFIQMDFDAKDLTYNISAYFFLWGVYALGRYYIGNELMEKFLLWMIEVGAVTAVIMPLCAFVISYIKGGIKNEERYY